MWPWIRATLTFWILLQILMIPLCTVPVFLVASESILLRLRSVSLHSFQAKSDLTGNCDVLLVMVRRAACLRAIIGSLSYVLALLLAIGNGFVISTAHFCGPSSGLSGGSSRLWISVFCLYGGVSSVLLFAATFSVFCSWCTFCGSAPRV